MRKPFGLDSVSGTDKQHLGGGALALDLLAHGDGGKQVTAGASARDNRLHQRAPERAAAARAADPSTGCARLLAALILALGGASDEVRTSLLRIAGWRERASNAPNSASAITIELPP